MRILHQLLSVGVPTVKTAHPESADAGKSRLGLFYILKQGRNQEKIRDNCGWDCLKGRTTEKTAHPESADAGKLRLGLFERAHNRKNRAFEN